MLLADRRFLFWIMYGFVVSESQYRFSTCTCVAVYLDQHSDFSTPRHCFTKETCSWVNVFCSFCTILWKQFICMYIAPLITIDPVYILHYVCFLLQHLAGRSLDLLTLLIRFTRCLWCVMTATSHILRTQFPLSILCSCGAFEWFHVLSWPTVGPKIRIKLRFWY